MSGQGWAELIQELEQASRALLDALTRRDPCYLEHLEGRENALRQISKISPAWEGGTAVADLDLARRLGVSAVREGELMREEMNRELRVLGSQRRLAHSLGAAGAAQHTTLDLKA